MTIRNGHLSIVERLLQDTRVDPSGNGNADIRNACENRHIEIVERLLQDHRVDPSIVPVTFFQIAI